MANQRKKPHILIIIVFDSIICVMGNVTHTQTSMHEKDTVNNLSEKQGKRSQKFLTLTYYYNDLNDVRLKSMLLLFFPISSKKIDGIEHI